MVKVIEKAYTVWNGGIDDIYPVFVSAKKISEAKQKAWSDINDDGDCNGVPFVNIRAKRNYSRDKVIFNGEIMLRCDMQRQIATQHYHKEAKKVHRANKGAKVKILSKEHSMYWRGKGGYTYDFSEAMTFDIDEALKIILATCSQKRLEMIVCK